MTIKLNVRDKLEDDTLDLSLCDLQEVPVREIASIRRATTVDLSNNQLVTLPKNFVTLTQIVKLDLSKNMLIEIPENFGEMRQLKHLDLYGNQISRLPLSLGDLKNLKWLDLKDNPLTPAVATVAGPCSNASDCQACARNIVAYLSNAREKIEEEKQRRSIAAAAATAAAVSAETLGKKEAKKKKKKPNAEKLNNKDTSNLQQIELEQRKTTFCNDEKFQRQHRFNDESSNTAGAIGVLFRAFFWIMMWLLFLGILVFLGLSVFFTYDEQRSKQFLEYAESQTGLPMKHYKELGVKIAKDAMDNVRLWSGEAQNVIFDACTRYFGTKRNKNEL